MIFRSFLTNGTKTKVAGGTWHSFAYLSSNLGLKKKTLLIVGIPSLLLFLRFLTIPSCVKSEWALSVVKDRNHVFAEQDSIDVSKVTKTIIYSGFFSLDRSLDSTASKGLLNHLLNYENYKEGEWGTPEYSKTLYYEDANGNLLGKTLLDEIGQTRTIPSPERQTKFGNLSKHTLEKILELIE